MISVCSSSPSTITEKPPHSGGGWGKDFLRAIGLVLLGLVLM